jgi:sugar lactone lactonase YvrE
MKSALAAAVCALALTTAYAFAQAPAAPTPGAAPATPQPFVAGQPLGVMVNGQLNPTSSNVKVYGAIFSAESCSYDATRNLIVVPNRGANQNMLANDAFVSLINHDGSVNTSRWIGVNRNGFTLNEPYGSDIQNGKLYLADSDGGLNGAPRQSVIRMFDIKTGAPAGEIQMPGVAWLNDIAVANDGTIYGSQTGSADDAKSWTINKITPDGKVSVFVTGAPLGRPNGVAIDPQGNIVVLNMNDASVLTFSPAAKLLKTETAAQPGNDGLVIMPDGTKYISSVMNGGVTRLRPNGQAELIATNIPQAASMCYDAGANQLVIPMNANNALAFIKLQ